MEVRPVNAPLAHLFDKPEGIQDQPDDPDYGKRQPCSEVDEGMVRPVGPLGLAFQPERATSNYTPMKAPNSAPIMPTKCLATLPSFYSSRLRS